MRALIQDIIVQSRAPGLERISRRVVKATEQALLMELVCSEEGEPSDMEAGSAR